jgi:hypothetical protein
MPVGTRAEATTPGQLDSETALARDLPYPWALAAGSHRSRPRTQVLPVCTAPTSISSSSFQLEVHLARAGVRVRLGRCSIVFVKPPQATQPAAAFLKVQVHWQLEVTLAAPLVSL